MERKYETTLIVDADLSEELIRSEADKLIEVIKAHGDSTAECVMVGKRPLEYPMNKKNNGFFVLINHSGDQGVVADIARQALISEKIFRHFTVKKDKHATVGDFEKLEEVTSRGPNQRGRSDRNFDRQNDRSDSSRDAASSAKPRESNSSQVSESSASGDATS